MKPIFEFKPQSAALVGEPINTELKAHALGAEWRHHEAITLLHQWAERFNRVFQLALELPVIAIGRMPVRTQGTYCPGRNALGLQHEIRLNEGHLKDPLGVEPGPFTKLLDQYNIDMDTLPALAGDLPPLAAKRRHGDSKMKKWSCLCKNVRCAVTLRARCLDCGALFEESRPAW
jgi:hypothetical protein